MEKLRVRSVLVTGSDRGVGLGLVTRFLEKQNPPEWVFATSLDLEGFYGKKLRRLVSWHPNLVMLQLDIRDLKSIAAAVQKVEEHVKGNGLTLLINNAGILVKFTCLATESAENMARLYDTNTIGTLQVSQAFLPLLKTAALRSPEEGLSCSKAAVVNISSDFGSIEKMAGWCLSQVVSYRCSKAALNMLTRCQSLENKPFGILCLSIHPGWVKTAMGTQLFPTLDIVKVTAIPITGVPPLGRPPDLLLVELEDTVRHLWKSLVPTTVKESTSGIVKVLSEVTERDTGSFLDWEGNTVPW